MVPVLVSDDGSSLIIVTAMSLSKTIIKLVEERYETKIKQHQ